MNRRNGQVTVGMVSAVIVLVTLAVYWQVHAYEFCYDDGLYVTGNQHVRSGLTLGNVRWAFTAEYASNWHPLTWLSHMLDCQLFGLNAGAHHLMNVLLHLANTVLLFVVLNRMTKVFWCSAFVAGLFALHPLHVESVAWVAERKDVLSTFFWLLTMWSYLKYAERPGFGRYVLVMVLFVLGLMAKPMLVTLPFVLLLLDYWPLARLQLGRPTDTDQGETDKSVNERDKRKTAICLVVEKIPLLLLAATSCVVTYLVQQSGGAIKPIPLGARLANAMVSYGRYIEKMFWPGKLAVFYPYSRVVEIRPLLGWGIFLGLVTLLAFFWRRRRPWMLVGWLWYVGTLVPVIGLVQVGGQAMADRYTYIPLIGLFIVVAWSVRELTAKQPIAKMILGACGVVVLAALTICTWFQIGHWRNNITLYEHALKVTAGNALLYDNLGVEYLAQGKVDKAIRHHQAALRLNPNYYKAYYHLGAILGRRGKSEEAIEHLIKAMELKPNGPKIHNELAAVFYRQGKFNEAVRHWGEAVRLEPDWAKVKNNLAWVLATVEDETLRNPARAVELAERACELTDYNQPAMLDTLGVAYAAGGRFAEAVEIAEKARELAAASGRKELVSDIEKHLELYKVNKPYSD